MAVRKKRPSARRARKPKRAFPTVSPLSLFAWLILAVGIGLLGGKLYQASRPGEARQQSSGATDHDRASRRQAPTSTPTPSQEPRKAKPRRKPAKDRPSPTRTPSAKRDSPSDILKPRSGKRRPRVAIVIDDIGRELDAIDRFAALPYKLTFAVIPHLKHSRSAAEALHRHGQQIILHQPMEPLDYPKNDPGKGAILSGMNADDIRRTVLTNLAAIPHVRGVNNHMGSRITSQRVEMRVVLETLADTPYFFIDSRTVASSVAYDLARDIGIPSAERSVFLDNVKTKAAITKQLDLLVTLAKRRGSAIAICHPYPVTLEVLAKQIPRLAARGIEVVFASELVS